MLKVTVIIINGSVQVMVGGKPTIQTLINLFKFDTIGTVCPMRRTTGQHGGFEHTNLLVSSSES